LLAALLSKNDYSSSILRHTLQKNAKIVQGIDLDAGSSHSIPTDSVKDAIRKYLERVETPHSRTPEHYKHAISAFVECREDRSDSATPSTSTHDQICALLRSLEMKKLARRASRSSPADPSQSSTAPQQRELQPYNGQQQDQKREPRKRKKKRKTKKKRQRVSTWKHSRWEH